MFPEKSITKGRIVDDLLPTTKRLAVRVDPSSQISYEEQLPTTTPYDQEQNAQMLLGPFMAAPIASSVVARIVAGVARPE